MKRGRTLNKAEGISRNRSAMGYLVTKPDAKRFRT